MVTAVSGSSVLLATSSVPAPGIIATLTGAAQSAAAAVAASPALSIIVALGLLGIGVAIALKISDQRIKKLKLELKQARQNLELVMVRTMAKAAFALNQRSQEDILEEARERACTRRMRLASVTKPFVLQQALTEFEQKHADETNLEKKEYKEYLETLSKKFYNDSLSLEWFSGPEPKEIEQIESFDFAAAAAFAKEHVQKANEQNPVRLARLFAMRTTQVSAEKDLTSIQLALETLKNPANLNSEFAHSSEALEQDLDRRFDAPDRRFHTTHGPTIDEIGGMTREQAIAFGLEHIRTKKVTVT